MSLSKSLVSWSIGMLLLSFLVTSVLVYQLHMAQFESRWKEILYIDLSGVNYETQTQTLPSKTYSELKLSTSVSNEDFFKNYEFIKLLTNDQWLVRHLSANKITEYRLSELGFSANNFQFQFKRVNNQVYGLYKIPGALGLLPENKSVWIFAHRDISESYYDFIFETVLHVVITILVFLTFQIGHHIILRRQILVPMVNMIRNTDSLLLNNNL
ncbi:MAG: hypothetical protein P1U57_08980, partial [Oleibacter sp.]|nr:hypothetical protein [Thalassolituus sp.]